MPTVVLGLGSNSADKCFMLRRAGILINVIVGTTISCSRIYSTAPWGYMEQADFVNQVLMISTELSPSEVHSKILEIEHILDKKKGPVKFGPRNIDIDILLYENVVSENEHLTIPHPRMHLRNFVLIPLREIAPEIVHPVFHKSISELLEECEDESLVMAQEKQ